VKVVATAADLRAARAPLSSPVAIVPTMGYLHQGHLSLVARARAECQGVVVSIFVNPTQFGPSEDFARYPRDLARDLDLCEKAGVDIVFTPPESEMYPPGFSTSVEVTGLQDRWEGSSRPGHFRGVATVVARLFRLALPDRAYFGEKDYQQLQIVTRMARDLALDVEVVPCATVREADGLAMSSRNAYLDQESRRHAIALWEALSAARELAATDEADGEALLAAMRAEIARHPAVALDYVAIVEPATLEPLETVAGAARALIAARVGGVRLIDNGPIVVPTRHQGAEAR
jgi:pantoate--beta-alanine ligase